MNCAVMFASFRSGPGPFLPAVIEAFEVSEVSPRRLDFDDSIEGSESSWSLLTGAFKYGGDSNRSVSRLRGLSGLLSYSGLRTGLLVGQSSSS